jgi:hypothetical protein
LFIIFVFLFGEKLLNEDSAFVIISGDQTLNVLTNRLCLCKLVFQGNYMFFGCRNKEKDFFCRNEWQQLENASLLKLFVAFSRDQVKFEL